MSENIKERLLEIIAVCKARYSSPDSIAALQKTFQSHNITIEDWNSLIEYVKTAIDTGNDLIEVIDLIGEYVIQTVEDKMEEVVDTVLSQKADKIGELPHFTVLDNDDVLTFIENNNLNGKPIVLKHSINSYIGQFRVLRVSSVIAYLGFHFKALDGTSVYSGGFDLEDISTPSPKFSDLFSNTYLNAVALAKGPLPKYEVNGTDNVADFITSKNVNKQPIIVTFTAFGQVLLGAFSASGQTGHYHFEFDELKSTQRFLGQNIDLTNITFTSLFAPIPSNPYLDHYELRSNKVTSLSVSSTNEQYPSAKLVYDQLQTKENVSNKVTVLSGSSTDTQYPSAKVVWDNMQNIREVAEGKCKTYVLNYNQTQPQYQNCEYYDPTTETFIAFENAQEMTTWIGNSNIANNLFNTNSDKININPQSTDYLIFRNIYKKVYSMVRIRDAFITGGGSTITPDKLFKKGDMFLIIETDVPDRWFSGTYEGSTGSVVFYKLETSKIDLTQYYTKDQIAALFSSYITSPYDNTSTYAVGKYVTYNGVLYRCVTAIDVAEDFDSSKWTVVTVGSELGRMVTTDTEQEIKSKKTMKDTSLEFSKTGVSGNTKWVLEEDNYGRLTISRIYNGNKVVYWTYDGGNLSPNSNDANTLGSSSKKIAEFFVNLLNKNANGKGLTLPDTTNFAANKEIATTDLGKLLTIESQRHLTSGEAKQCVGGIQVVSDYFLNLGSGVLLKNPYITGIRVTNTTVDITAVGLNTSTQMVLYKGRLTINDSDDSAAVTESDITTRVLDDIATTDEIGIKDYGEITAATSSNIIDEINTYGGRFTYTANGNTFAVIKMPKSSRTGALLSLAYRVSISGEGGNYYIELGRLTGDANIYTNSGSLFSGVCHSNANDNLNIKKINNKTIPNYPTTNTSPQVLIIDANGGNLSWSDDGLCNVINAADIVNDTLTQAQFDLISNGKPTIIKGTYKNRINQVWFTAKQQDDNLTVLSIGSRNQYTQTFLTQITINGNTKVISYSSTNDIFMNSTLGMYLTKVYQINGKTIPTYPSSPSVPQVLIYDTDNTLKWNGDGIFNIIKVSEMTDSVHFTEAQLDIIKNGKMTRIEGILGSNQLANVTFLSCQEEANYLNVLVSYANSSNDKGFTYVKITKSNGYVNIRNNKICFSQNEIRLLTDNGTSNSIYINGKKLPNHPSDTGTWVMKCIDGVLTWVQE